MGRSVSAVAWHEWLQTYGEAVPRITAAAGGDLRLVQHACNWAKAHFIHEADQLVAAEFFAGMFRLSAYLSAPPSSVPTASVTAQIQQLITVVKASFSKLPGVSVAPVRAEQPASFDDLHRIFMKEMRALTGALSTPGLPPTRRDDLKLAIAQAYVLFGQALSAGQEGLETDEEFGQWCQTEEYRNWATHRQRISDEFASEIRLVEAHHFDQFYVFDSTQWISHRDWLRRPNWGLDDFYARYSPVRADGSRAQIHWVGLAQDGAVLAALVAAQARQHGWGTTTHPGQLGFLLATARTEDRRADGFELTLSIDQVEYGDTVVLMDDTIASGTTMRRAIERMTPLLREKNIQLVIAVMYPMGETEFSDYPQAYPLFSVVAEEKQVIFARRNQQRSVDPEDSR